MEVLLPRNSLPASSKSRSTNNSFVMGDDFKEIWKLLTIPYSKLSIVSVMPQSHVEYLGKVKVNAWNPPPPSEARSPNLGLSKSALFQLGTRLFSPLPNWDSANQPSSNLGLGYSALSQLETWLFSPLPTWDSAIRSSPKWGPGN
ncbi:hypothetical protein Fot_29409 [Forsythia ovata]|uniref:Uncharacterized protein n=1 Tax=Forsythia ovata TaxID=205694 RepID=A0ABD1TS91_9LAMI